MQTIKEKFFDEFELVRMSGNSIVVRDKMNRDIFVHRNVFNNILNDTAVDYRVIEKGFDVNRPCLWLDALVWKSI